MDRKRKIYSPSTTATGMWNGLPKKRIGCHPDIRLKKTNYLKTNLLKQIKISFLLYTLINIFVFTLQRYMF